MAQATAPDQPLEVWKNFLYVRNLELLSGSDKVEAQPRVNSPRPVPLFSLHLRKGANRAVVAVLHLHNVFCSDRLAC